MGYASSQAKYAMTDDEDDSLSVSGCHDGKNDDDSDCESGRGTASATDSSSQGEFQLATGETRQVNVLRGILALVLILAASTVSVFVYRYSVAEERNNFEVAFNSQSSKVTESLKLNVERMLTSMDAYSAAVTSYASVQERSWPFVTLPGFERRVHSLLSQIKGLSFVTQLIVTDEDRHEWERYAVEVFQTWSNESKAFQAAGGYDLKYQYPPSSSSSSSEEEEQHMDNVRRSLYTGFPEDKFPTMERHLKEEDDGSSEQELDEEIYAISNSTQDIVPIEFENGIPNKIWSYAPTGGKSVDPDGLGTYLPLWQHAPYIAIEAELMNLAWGGDPYEVHKVVLVDKMASMGQTTNVQEPNKFNEGLLVAITALIKTWGIEGAEVGKDPVGSFNFPIIDSYNNDKAVGMINMYLHWRSIFLNLLPEGANGINAVFSSTCSGNFTYDINGPIATYKGAGDLHDPAYDHLVQSVSVVDAFYERLATGTQYSGPALSSETCDYTLKVYPTSVMENEYVTKLPLFYSIAVLGIFIFTSIVFAIYDITIEKRQRLVMRNALKTNKIVNSLFPAAVANRMIDEGDDDSSSKKGGYTSNKQRLKTFLNDGDDKITEEVMADLYESTTVMFADIVNFTSWASAREPAQVFLLLQTLYQSFDRIAHKRKVFKVETVGDSYVAVAGLPERQDDHALRMARFALECANKVAILTKQLEVTLGPDTGDIEMRFGLHSGPCTAGVLRGERARFQLFGDTVNMAARMESRIQVSKATAQLLKDCGKGDMIIPRPDEVNIKGKGITETYFLVPRRAGSVVSSLCSVPGLNREERAHRRKTQRLIEWNVNILKEQLRKVVARRQAVKGKKLRNSTKQRDLRYTMEDRGGKTCLEEIEDIIAMPPCDPKTMANEADPASIDLGPEVSSQLKKFVEQVAARYHMNPFHNFEHASHVAMAVDKLLTRVVKPDIDSDQAGDTVAVDLHDLTHGITSDPLTHFAIVMSALIHDVDHRGVSNMQLAKEDPMMAELYKNKSIAEQNSCDVAWELLMQPGMEDLRACIYSDQEELHRFRQCIIKVVLATDIFDKELNDLRKQRWNKAFADRSGDHSAPESSSSSGNEVVNVKATIVIEHLIQASDVSHTMQHWHIYRKWNERLFCELYEAFKAGRMGKNPAEFWYKGEIGFFDNYIIPLTKKLKECNVFGVSSAEYLSYAMANREEWEQKGEQIVADMVQKYQSGTASILEEEESEEEDDTLHASALQLSV